MIEITDCPDIKQWSEFVYNHPHGNIFQTPELAEVYKRTKNYEPITLAVIDDATDEMLAVLLAVVIKEKSVLGSFSARSVIHGGPLFISDKRGMDTVRILIEYYDKISRKKSLYTLVRNMYDTSEVSSTFNSMGYEYEDHLNFLIDLTKSEEELWAELSKSRRRFIRKAREKSVTIEEIKNSNLISTFYDLLQQTYKDAKIPLANISLFESAFDILTPKNMLKFFLAKYNKEYIGGIMVPMYKGVISEWYVCGSRAHSKLYPSEMVTWHPIEWGSENGYHVFDFGGAGKPNEEYGVREFKKQFGGKLVNYGRYTKVYAPIKMKIAEKGFNIYREISFLAHKKLCIAKEG